MCEISLLYGNQFESIDGRITIGLLKAHKWSNKIENEDKEMVACD
jgi:hypothetical protein